ncbi:MAG: hypothetical protein JSS65_10230 [Armatimonadetes bacterium]|nr:hypothetical protein [Armatimonadota bacterium]
MKRLLFFALAALAMSSFAFAQHGHGDNGKGGKHGPPDFAKGQGKRDGELEANNRGGRKAAGPPCVMSRKSGAGDYTNSSYRSGTFHYDNGLHKGHYKFHGYAEEFDGQRAPSPWYDYVHMPAYIQTAHVRVSIGGLFEFEAGAAYSYQPHHFSRFDESRLDNVADRLGEAFKDKDFDRMGWLVDDNRWVQVQVGDADHYDMKGGAFKDVVRDLVDETRTSSYRVKSVRSWDDGASIVAEHCFIDPFGQRKTAWHSYGLEKTDHGYRLTSFRSESK